MNCAPHHLSALAGLLLGAAAVAQSPENPPPWWGVQDNATVSLYWSFDGATPLQPTLAVVPPWYNPTVTGFSATPNLTVLGTLGTHIGVLGLQGTGTPQSAALDLTVDNDPYVDWIKVFWFQFDAFEGASGSIAAAIEESLAYKRAIVSQKSVPLGLGWQRVTIEAQLIPQPDDEGIDWTFVENAAGTIGIDNLFVNSKCVKPQPDQTGDALGDAGNRVNLTLVTNGADCRGVAVTEGPPPTFLKQYWVSVRAQAGGVPHSLLRLSSTAPITVVGTTLLGGTIASVPQGPGDLTVETRTTAGVVTQQIVWVVLDQRATALPVLLQGVDAATGTVTTLPIAFPGPALVPTNQTLGLAYDPSGDLGNGSFWVSSTDAGGQGTMREFRRSNGALLDTRPIEAGTVGLGYDDTLGNFYGFSRAPQPTPTLPIQTNGFELSGYDFQTTGVRFCGDLTIGNGAGPRGGVAAGFDVYRSRTALTSQLTMVCLVDTPGNPIAQQALYELAGPFGFGWSRLGRCGMRDTGPFRGVPFLGSTLEVTLTGVPNTLFAALFLGFSNTTSTVGPLPLSLSTVLGWPESVLSVAPDVNTGLLLPTANGDFVFPIAIPPAAALGYTPIFCQWLALDSSVQGFFAMSQAGKTVLYP